MKSFLFPVFFLVFVLPSIAQTEFEGSYAYKTTVEPFIKELSLQSIQNLLLADDSARGWYKNGKDKQVSSRWQAYVIPDKKRAYFVFKGIDSLYYVEFNAGSGQPENMQKETTGKKVAGYDTHTISYVLNGDQKKIFYAPLLYINPEYQQENKLTANNVISREIKSFRMETITTNHIYRVTESCYRVEPGKLDDAIFTLPGLPEASLVTSGIFKPAEFPGKEAAWNKYIQNNLSTDLAVKYVKIPKGSDNAMQEVKVEFYISDEGRPVHIVVTNKNEVHPKLAAEAVRVINECPNWKPATMIGKKIFGYYKQPVTFAVTR